MKRFKSRMIVCIILAAISLLLGVLSTVLPAGMISLTVLSSTAFNNDGTSVPSLGGYSLITVQSDSMKPEFSKGALIVVKKATTEQRTQYKEGDVITYVDYQSDGSHILVTSRVKKVEELTVRTYTVLGDNKDYDLTGGKGEPVFCNDVLGHYTGIAIPGAGAVVDFAQTPIGVIVFLILALISILATLVCLAIFLIGLIGAIVNGTRIRRKIA